MKADLKTSIMAAAALVFAFAQPVSAADIKGVMKAAMKGDDSLFKKATDGKASDAELKKLAACLKNLEGQKPPKGDAAAFQTKVTALIAAANDVAGGKKEAVPALKEAGNCKACHSEFKGK